MSPKISIITPVYDNGKEYTGLKWLDILNICLNNQIEQDFEWLIMYDGKSEECEEQVKKYNKARYFESEKRQGNWGNFSRDFCSRQALGEYLVFIDQDNIIFKDYLSKLSSLLDTNNEIGIALCPIYLSKSCAIKIVLPDIMTRSINTLMFMVRKSIFAVDFWWARLRGSGDEFTILKRLITNGIKDSKTGEEPLGIWNGARYKYSKIIYPDFIDYSVIQKIAGNQDSDTRKDKDLWFYLK